MVSIVGEKSKHLSDSEATLKQSLPYSDIGS
jgi:hypothetical protein